MNLKKLRNKKGFTLIELLVVVMILAILMAVALPLYLSSVANSENRTCRANLQTIGNALHANHVATRSAAPLGYPITAANATTISAALLTYAPDLLAVPICPTGGTYTIQAPTSGGAFDVQCSTHGDFIYGVSSQ